MPTNREVSTLLRQIAAVCQVVDKDAFRSRAYLNASGAIENLTIDIESLWRENKLDEIPGVGDSLKKYLDELLRTGKVKHFESEKKRVPAGMFALMSIRGIGPKTAYKISTKFHLNQYETAIGKLAELIKTNKISQLSGFGPQSQDRIANALSTGLRGKKRLLLGEAIPIATDFINYLKKSPSTIEAEMLGSLRRKTSTVGDIDIAISTKQPKLAMKHALSYSNISQIVSQGQSVAHVQLKNGREMDVKLSQPSEWGSLLQHYTGSKLHNINLRTLAISRKLSLSEHGIKDNYGKLHRFSSESSFYDYLKLQYIPPELREGEEEIEYAKQSKIPYLIQQSDIKGDLHLHSNFNFAVSHDLGVSPLSQILDFARQSKYEYVGISDHNPKVTKLDISTKKKIIIHRKDYLLSSYEQYEKRVKRNIPKMLIGMEVDIRPSGDLALEDELINLLDYAIVSIHSSFELDKPTNTARIIKALSHPKAIILGHPTGRLLNERNGIASDWLEIIDYCASNHKIMEINASVNRLDLPDDLIKQAVHKGVKLVINTDSHEVGQMSQIPYGVWSARRGWCKKHDIINTYSYSDLRRVLNLSS